MTRTDPDKDGQRSEQIDSTVQAITAYLRAHPNATDTLQGVRDWWLTDAARSWRLDVIQAALDRLVDSGAIEERPIPGGVVYGRSKHGDGE